MRIALAALAVGLVAAVGGGVKADASATQRTWINELAWAPNGVWLAYSQAVGEFANPTSVSVVRLDRRIQRRVIAVARRTA